jgi:DNA-directed RNA polymerase specialized sigma24 family protein
MTTTDSDVADLQAAIDVARLGDAARRARADLYGAVVVAIRDHGMSEREAAERAGLNRTTVRKLLGKG